MNQRLLLQGYKVLDVSRILVGAHCTMQLADLGAEVIKVEQPGHGDETREWGPPFRTMGENRDSTYFMSLNRNKKSIAVDLKHPEGKSIVNKLAKQS
jgi:crotonobetainyl-CoA:carnitine CoA-transferase CaiB-like acyl-CoA transferase